MYYKQPCTLNFSFLISSPMYLFNFKTFTITVDTDMLIKTWKRFALIGQCLFFFL